jgi:N-hydroxyarylamine O-acetyltransferase
LESVADDDLAPSQVAGYLARLGVGRPAAADEETLRRLQLRHLLSVPFENLSIHRREPIELVAGSLVDKLVTARRGGFCYELNGAFAALLTALGFNVSLVAVRVVTPGGLGLPFGHLALRIGLDQPFLVDVGFGGFAHQPLRLDDRGDQADPAGTFRISEIDHGDLEVSWDGVPKYVLDLRPRQLADFEAMSWWHRTSPQSHFTQTLICSQLFEGGRVSLSDRVLIRTSGRDRDEETLATDDQVLEAYRQWFGIALDRVPTLWAPVS